MSSSYSSDLRIELIGTGDQAGVWGATTNNNLNYVIEQAVAGYISVAVSSANQALTAINGGSSVPGDNQAVYAGIALTTSTGANFAVYAPPAPKQYVIYNASSYTATIYNSTVIGNTTAAGTGVAIPAGKTMTVWSDGSNFAQQNTHFLSPALTGTPTAPTATYGTSTTQVATTAFVQAALQALYPIGSIYSSTVSTNPGTLFGFGTWVAYAAGRVMIGQDGGSYPAGATGGSADATLVSHTHTASSSSSFTGSGGTTSANNVGHTHTWGNQTGGQSASHTHSVTVDSGGAHAHTYKTYGLGSSSLIGNAYTNYDWGWATTGNPAGTNEGTHNHSASAGLNSSDHSHYVSGTTSGISNDHTHGFTPSGSVSTSTSLSTNGSSATNANLQPYVVVYMWNRTA